MFLVSKRVTMAILNGQHFMIENVGVIIITAYIDMEIFIII